MPALDRAITNADRMPALPAFLLAMAKDVKVFISSTCKDLKQDCRTEAIKTIELVDGAEAVAMEKWFDDYQYTIEMCLEKLEMSTHFLGIFAYRYGWRPGGNADTSITEKEFDHARGLGEKVKMFILIPEEGTPIHTELWKRANEEPHKQPEEDKQAQLLFLGRVGKKAVRTFDSLPALVRWVALKITAWQNNEGGFREIASTTSVASATPPRPSFVTLGRLKETRTFEDCLSNEVLANSPEIACFLIHGKAGYGHEELLNRLRDKLRNERESLSISVDAGANWRSKDVSALLEVIGQEMKETFLTIETLAARLKQEMTKLDVILQFDNLQRWNTDLPEFLDQFWKPLATAFTAADVDLPCRLIGLASYKGALNPTWEDDLYRPGSGAAFDNARLIALPELGDFQETELLLWLKQQKLAPAKAKDLAAKLIQETGGNPPALFLELMKDAIWKS